MVVRHALRRRELEDAVERAIALLNALDGDPDMEPSFEDEGAFEEDDDTSDFEASMCGVSFGTGGTLGNDREATTAPFTMDQRELEHA